MREPKGSVLILALAVIIVTESAPVVQENLPHSREYYDGYVKALVDHFDDLFRNVRDVSADNTDAKETEDASQNDAKKGYVENSGANVGSEDQFVARSNQQTSDQSEKIQDRPYTNPEQTGKPPVTDTEKEEQPTPDAHLKDENEQSSASTVSGKEIKQSMFKAEGASNLPETMQDIKLYTGKSKDFEDMKKRSTDESVITKTFVTKPVASSFAPILTSPVVASQVDQVATHPASPLVASAGVPSVNAPVITSASAPASQLAVTTAAVTTAAAPSPVAGSSVASVTTLASPPASLTNSKRNDMQSESKVISHSSSTYTPGDPFSNQPQQKPTPPDPNKEEPYKKDEGSGKDDEETEEAKDDESSSSEEESSKDKEAMAENKGEEKKENENKDVKEEGKKEENADVETKEAEKEFKSESNEEGADDEFANTPVQPFMGMVLIPMGENQDVDSLLSSAGERKDNVGAKRGDEKEKEKEDKKDDDDDDDEHNNHAYLAPLWGYPGWYEAGHGIPYGYGTNMLHGHHGHHGYGGHHYVEFGHHGLGHPGYGHHGLGHYGYGHHGLGHHGYGHHGYGYHGLGHHGNVVLDNGVIWPFGGHFASYFHTPCGCNGGPARSDMGLSLPFSFS